MFPITHGLIGWSIAQPLKTRKDRMLITAASLLPDLDGLGALISIDYYSKYHHVFGHNFFFGLGLSLLAFLFAQQKKIASFLVFISFNSHILGDLLGSGAGWGIPYWWPLDSKVYEFTPPFQWELDSWQNFLVTFVCIIFVILCAVFKGRSIVEIFSVKADREVVKVFRKWFKRGIS